MGSNSRYDGDRPVGDREAAEARAFHTIAELLAHHPELITDRAVAGQVAHLLHNSAIELDAGRPLPPSACGAPSVVSPPRSAPRWIPVRKPAHDGDGGPPLTRWTACSSC